MKRLFIAVAKTTFTKKNKNNEIAKIIGIYLSPAFSLPVWITPKVKEANIPVTIRVATENKLMKSCEIMFLEPPIRLVIFIAEEAACCAKSVKFTVVDWVARIPTIVLEIPNRIGAPAAAVKKIIIT